MLSLVLCVPTWFFFQAEDGIRDLVRSRGLGDVYKRQGIAALGPALTLDRHPEILKHRDVAPDRAAVDFEPCLLYTSDAAAERSSVDLGGRRII